MAIITEKGFKKIEYTDPADIPAVVNHNVDNVEEIINDLDKPTFSESETTDNISSGETLGVLFGKIKKAIADLISHITDKSIHCPIFIGDEEPTGDNYLWFAPYKPQENVDEIILQSIDYNGDETKLHVEVDGKLNTVDNSDINGENVILFE